MNKAQQFLKEYEQLCRKYDLVIDTPGPHSDCVRIMSIKNQYFILHHDNNPISQYIIYLDPENNREYLDE